MGNTSCCSDEEKLKLINQIENKTVINYDQSNEIEILKNEKNEI